jgi:hypothetical protein
MDLPLRAALIAWLAADPDLSVQLNAITEEAPARTSLPWLAIATSASADWSTKTEAGYEIRIALELHCRGDTPNAAAELVGAIDARIRALPTQQSGFRVATIRFLRARTQQTDAATRTVLIEFSFRTLNGERS